MKMHAFDSYRSPGVLVAPLLVSLFLWLSPYCLAALDDGRCAPLPWNESQPFFTPQELVQQLHQQKISLSYFNKRINDLLFHSALNDFNIIVYRNELSEASLQHEEVRAVILANFASVPGQGSVDRCEREALQILKDAIDIEEVRAAFLLKLADPQNVLRVSMIHAFQGHLDEAVRKLLVSIALTDSDLMIRTATLSVLRRSFETSTDARLAYAAGLQETDVPLRREAAWGLGAMANTDAVARQILINLAIASDHFSRRIAAEALEVAATNHDDVRVTLTSLLRDADIEVRLVASMSLADAAKIHKSVQEALLSRFLCDSSETVRIHLATILLQVLPIDTIEKHLVKFLSSLNDNRMALEVFKVLERAPSLTPHTLKVVAKYLGPFLPRFGLVQRLFVGQVKMSNELRQSAARILANQSTGVPPSQRALSICETLLEVKHRVDGMFN